MHQRREREKAVVADAENAHTAVALRHMLHQPVDGVVGVGRFIHGRWIERTAEGPVHDVIALAAVLAANVLHDADVPAIDDRLCRVVVAPQAYVQVDAGCVGGEDDGVVGGPRHEHAGVLRAHGHQKNRVQLDTVAHRDHYVAPLMIHARGGPLKRRRSFTWVVRVEGCLLRASSEDHHQEGARHTHNDLPQTRHSASKDFKGIYEDGITSQPAWPCEPRKTGHSSAA